MNLHSISKIWRAVITLMFVLFGGGQQASAANPSDLEQLVQIALSQNPSLEAIELELTALRHQLTATAAWRDPKLAVAYQNFPLAGPQNGAENMNMVTARIEQQIPWAGKTESRAAVVHQSIEMKSWELKEKRNQLRRSIKQSYYRLSLARQLQKLTAKHAVLVEQLINAVRIKYEVGRAPQHSLVRLEVLHDKLKDDVDEFERQQIALQAAINSALHRDSNIPLTTPAEFELKAPTLSLKALLAQAVDNRPALKSLGTRSQMQQSAATVARDEATPDATLFGSYGYRPLTGSNPVSKHLVTVGVALPLPLFSDSSHGAKAAALDSKARASIARQNALKDMIERDLAGTLATWGRLVRKTHTYKTKLVPGAQRALDATFSSYQVDRATFLALFEAQVDLINFEKSIHIAAADALVAQAAIEALVGKGL